jgi:hypothetical protein
MSACFSAVEFLRPNATEYLRAYILTTLKHYSRFSCFENSPKNLAASVFKQSSQYGTVYSEQLLNYSQFEVNIV